jgi:hypothetical protein
MKYEQVFIKLGSELPEKDGEYFVNRSGFMSVYDYEKGHSDMLWKKEIRYWLKPIPEQPESVKDKIIGKLEELNEDKKIIDKMRSIDYRQFQSIRERDKYEQGFLTCLQWIKSELAELKKELKLHQ